ncbi:unnamed protein product [Brachionus calyciflorus]|uniref:SH3 domain-containing protein n=1 Tax=Brachionus calyciflorus TaxID=104777 RepID=A0A813PDJ0_9BILA|nr:unnamed protein product [Brachionus calyciflorus]
MSEPTDQAQIRPLYQVEKDNEELRKDLDEKLKNYSKIELKNYNKDKEAYKQAIEDAVKSLQEYLAKTSDLLTRINDLKKEDEDSSLKEKDFKKRQTNEAKKIKELQSKIEKTTKKLNQDLDKQKKADEKEDAKKAKLEEKNKKNDTKKNDNSNLREIVTEIIKSDQGNKQDEHTEETREEENNDDEEEQDKSKETEKPKVALTLKEMIAQAKKAKQAREKEEENDQDESEEDDGNDLDDEYESEKEEKDSKEPKEKFGQNLLNIFKNQNKKEEPVKSDEEKTRKPSTSKINNEAEPAKEQELKKKEENKTNEPSEEKDDEKEKEEEGDDREENDEGEEIEQKIEESKQEVEFEVGTKFLVINDYEAEIEDDLDVKKGEIVEFEDLTEDPDYIIVKNSEGNSGSVLLSNLRSLEKEDQQEDENIEPVKTEERDVDEEKAGKKSKKSKKKDLINSNALIINEAVPSTFSDSTLGKLSKNPAHSYEAILKPQMSQSHLNFHNFYWDSKDNKIRNRMTSILKTIKLHKCVNIPVPNKTDLEVLSRTVRICLFDGVSVLANIYTIRAQAVSKDERTWLFQDEYNNVISLLDFSEFFLLTNTIPEKPNLGLLFELSIYAKKPNTEEETELCCGWAHLPFMDSENNFQLVNKSYDLVLNGGSVYDKNMPLDPNVPRNTGPINDIITKLFKESKIKFTFRDPTSQVIETLNVLPSPLICSSLTATFIKYYYEELAANFLVPLSDLGSFDVTTEPIHSEFLKTFPKALENPDILNAARIFFNYQKDHLKRDEKNDQLKLRKLFLKIYCELCYPLLFNYTLPPLVLHKQELMESRQITIDLIAKKARKENSIEYLFDDNYKFEPFYTEELRFEIFA